MKLAFLPILFLFFITGTAKGQLCADSSIHLRYSFADSVYPTHETGLADGGRIQLLRTFRKVSSPGPDFIIRYSNDARPVWCRQLVPGTGTDLLQATRVAELANGNIVISGFSRQSGNRETYFYIMMLSPAGQPLWQKIVEYRDIYSVAGNFGQSNKINGSICESRGDSLLFTFQVEAESIVGEKIAVLCTDQYGNTGWARTIVIPTVAEEWVAVAKARVTGNTLWLYGAHTSIDYCPDAAPATGYINRGKLMAIAFDLNTHTILSQHSYCPPITTLAGFSGSVPGYQHYGSLNENTSSYGQDIFFLSDGRVALTRSRVRATNIPEIKNWLFSISYFDREFKPIKSELISTGSLLLQATIQSVNIDSAGNKHFHFVDYNSHTTYYAVADSNNHFVVQRKLKGDWDSPLFHQPRYMSAPGYLTSFEIFNPKNNQTNIDYFQIQAKNLGSACFGEDSSFLSFDQASLGYSSFRGLISSRPSNLLEYSANAALQDLNMNTAVICVEKEICDTLHLNGPANSCNNTDPVKLTVYKNPLCKGAIQFYFDTAAVHSYSQPDDTTLLLSLNGQGYQGKIIAAAASCPQLRDSITLDIPAQSTTFNIGTDQPFCPGSSYRISASPHYISYLWQDNSTDSFIVARQPGYYSVNVIDRCGQQYADTIFLSPPEALLSAGKDTTVCRFSSLLLEATPGFFDYSWKTTAIPGRIQLGIRVETFPENTTSYIVEASLFESCRLTDTILVSVQHCSNRFFVPSAFTPNNDGLNDGFKPLIDGALESYRFTIFNRWGEQVFASAQPGQPWNGMVRGVLQPATTFIWKCEYKFYGESPQNRKGAVTLVR